MSSNETDPAEVPDTIDQHEPSEVPAADDDSRKVLNNALALSRRRPFRLGLIVGILITVAVVVLIVQNRESAQIDWLFIHRSAPLWLILLATMFAGAIAWEVVRIMLRHGRKRAALRKETTRQLKAM